MATAEEQRGDATAQGDPDGVSAFIVRVLNQLSLSAWLPGAVLIALLSCLLWFTRSGGVTFANAGSYVQDHWIPILVLALPCLVLSTLLTQAFSFGAIQVLEGYWGSSSVATWLRRLAIGHQLRRKARLEKKAASISPRAFASAKARLVALRVPSVVILALEMDAAGERRPADLTEEQHALADSTSWWLEAAPWIEARLTRLGSDIAAYPDWSRVMPTRLGNILRKAEDGLAAHGSLGGYVMRNRHLVPTRVLIHHDEFRTRLDMYCMLVFVSVTSALVSVGLLWDLTPIERASVPLALLLLGFLSYGAALTSARGYVVALSEIDNAVRLETESGPSNRHEPETDESTSGLAT